MARISSRPRARHTFFRRSGTCRTFSSAEGRTVKKLKPLLIVALLLAVIAGCGGTGAASTQGAKTVTVYTADGLADWYKTRFAAFTAKTGIEVQTVEAGSGEVVSRLAKEKSNPQ